MAVRGGDEPSQRGQDPHKGGGDGGHPGAGTGAGTPDGRMQDLGPSGRTDVAEVS